VRTGDSLTGIANIYGFDWQVIAELNNLKAPYKLYPGQWLCLPAAVGAEAASGTHPPYKLPRFTARVANNIVHIQTFNYPEKSVNRVKIADNQVPYGYIWFNLGDLRIQKNGNKQASYDLPAGLKKTPKLLVCLKDASTDALNCQATTNQVP